METTSGNATFPTLDVKAHKNHNGQASEMIKRVHLHLMQRVRVQIYISIREELTQVDAWHDKQKLSSLISAIAFMYLAIMLSVLVMLKCAWTSFLISASPIRGDSSFSSSSHFRSAPASPDRKAFLL